MRLKDYSMHIKKNIAVTLHIIFLIFAVSGISFIYLNTRIGSGISWLLDRQYEDSSQFQQQFQTDLDHILQYVAYRDVFETNSVLDLSKDMFSVTRADGPEIIYTLEEVLRYAKSQGFYLNDRFEVVNDLFIYDNVSTAKNYRVNWRAYDSNAAISEPGDAYTSLLDLSKEVLDCLSQYYTVYYQLIANPSNLYFQILYSDGERQQLLYTNAAHMTLEQLRSMGRYCFLTSDSVFIETNLDEIPHNMAVSMERNNVNNAEEYYMMIAVDTLYPVEDAYAEAAAGYRHMQSRLLEGLLGIAVGIIGGLATLYYLILASGSQTEESSSPILYGFDTITTEGCVALTFLFTLFALFLGEKMGYRLLHLLTQESSWAFAERMMRAVIIYGCCMIGAFSLLRRYKSHQLWGNSIIHRLIGNLNLYFANRTFSHRLFCLYSAFMAVQVVGIGLIAVLTRFHSHPLVKLFIILLTAGLVVIDCQTFHKLFAASVQKDRVAHAIAKIAGGDTAYQMDVEGLVGKELEIALMINSIGTGLEQALQEQVKSERLKADLITNVSHDIKTPLTSIINYVDLLKREQIPNQKIQEYLNVLDQKSQRLKNLTEDLVEASKASSGNLKLEMSNLNLVEMIWQTNGEFEEKFATRHLELVSRLPDEGIIIEADGRHLWRVLENLYNNAFKYAMEHSRVYTDVLQENERVYFIIKNVSEHPLNIHAGDLTERFVRGDVSRATEGSGLGLSIAQSLTRLQGGTFEIMVDGDLFKVRIGFPVGLSEYPPAADKIIGPPGT